MERVYVANLPPDIRIKDIDDFFRPFGKLVYIDVNHRANPVYAFVQFDSARNAINAVKSRHGYDYEGYTLQLRLVENEVRKRRDATPPPPPPPMFGCYERENNYDGFNNYTNNNSRMGGTFSNSFQSSSNFQWSNNNRSDMQRPQQNTSQYHTTSRQQNMVNLSTNNRSNNQQIASASSGRMNMQQQFYNVNRSSMQQQYSNSNRSDMLQQNMNYINSNLSNMPQQNNTRDYSNYSSWSNNSNRMGWNTNNYNSRMEHENIASNETYNQNSGPSARPDFEDNYTRGLSGSGRKWFNRYIRRGFSREEARAKALEHRTVPYLREDRRYNQVPNNSTNAALENIGTTLLSLLNTNQVANYNNNWGGENLQGTTNFDMPGPSSSSASGRVTSQPPCNAVSRKQYLKSLDILKKMRGKREQSAKDRISRKYHTQIVKDYEQFEKMSGKTGGSAARGNRREDKPLISTSSEAKLSIQLRRKKRELLLAAKRLGRETNRRYGGAYKKRFKILMNEAGFSELEAKALAIHPIEKLKSLMSIKKEYDMATKKTDFIPANKKVYSRTPKEVVYRNDIKYLDLYEKQRLSNLSPRIKSALIACLSRVHKFEKARNLPLTRTKFIALLQPKSTQKRKDENKQGSNSKRSVDKNDVKAGVTTSVKVEIKEEESKNLKVENSQEENLENQENEKQYDNNEEKRCENAEDPENDDGNDKNGENAGRCGDE